MWKQVKSFDQNKAGKESGMCLRNTRLGYGFDQRFDNAWEAWLNTEQHAMRNVPVGIDVPIYFWYINARNGHIGVRLANGKFWTDGRIYASIEAYEAEKAPNFVGWGESINEVRVIQHVADPAPVPKMPPVGSKVQLVPQQVRTTFKAGSPTPAGQIIVKDNTYIYTVRGYDSRYPGRIIINSASAGGDGVALALYFVNGAVIPGWKVV